MYPGREKLEEMYQARDKAVARLGAQAVITVANLSSLDRIGRFRVADELWSKCDPSARQALLHDEHAHVRSAAVISQMKPDPHAVDVRPLTEFEVKRLESVIANEDRCRSNGHVFSEFDIEQEGRYILGVGQYRASYEAGIV